MYAEKIDMKIGGKIVGYGSDYKKPLALKTQLKTIRYKHKNHIVKAYK